MNNKIINQERNNNWN